MSIHLIPHGFRHSVHVLLISMAKHTLSNMLCEISVWFESMLANFTGFVYYAAASPMSLWALYHA